AISSRKFFERIWQCNYGEFFAMRAALIGSLWQRQLMADDPSDSYTYFHGNGTLELEEFVLRNQGKHIVGMLSYDLGYELLDISQTKRDDLQIPDVYFLAFDTINSPELSHQPVALTAPFAPQLFRVDYDQAFAKIKN